MGDKMGITFGRPAQEILGRRKKRREIGEISDHTLQIANSLINYNPSHLGWKKILWTLVSRQKSSRRSYWPTQVDIFLETTFRPLGGSAPTDFLHALEIDIGYLAHPHRERGFPKKNFGLKVCVWDPITSGLVGISSPNFSMRRDELWSTNKKVIAHIDTPVLVHCKLTQVHTPRGSWIPFSESFVSCHCCERNFDFLNWLSTRTCGAGQPHVGLCPIFLVLVWF